MTKVVILQEYIPDYRVAFFERLTQLAELQGIQVTVAAGRPNNSQAARGDNSENASSFHLRQKELRLGRRRIVLRNIYRAVKGADLVILEQARRNLDVYLMFLPRILRKGAWALWGHGRDYVESRSRFASWLQTKITLRSDWFFAYTPGGARHLALHNYPPHRITTVMNSVDVAAIKEGLQKVTMDQVSSFRQLHGIDGRVVSFVGALDESKRLPFLIEAIRRLNGHLAGVSFVIAGDGPEREKLVRIAKELENVRFIGRADEESKHLLLSLSEFLVVPGRVGLIAADSLAAGVPIVTTDWEYHAPEFEYLENGRNSIIASDTVGDYAEAIAELLTNTALRQELSNNCLDQSRNLGVEQMSQNFLAGIMKILDIKERP